MSKYSVDKGIDILLVSLFYLFAIGGVLFMLRKNPEVFSPWLLIVIPIVTYLGARACMHIWNTDEQKMIDEIKKDIENDHRVEEIADEDFFNE